MPFAVLLKPLSPSLFGPLVVTAVLCALLLTTGKIPLGYNVRNLMVRWRTTLLTALAFTLVVGLLVVMMAFVNGMSQLTEQSGQPGNVIVLSDGTTDELMSNLGYSDSADILLQRGVMRDEQNRPLASREVYIVVTQPVVKRADADRARGELNRAGSGIGNREAAASQSHATASLGAGGSSPASPPTNSSRRRFVQVRGLEDPTISAKVHGLRLYSGGRWISESGVQRLQPPGSDTQEVVFEAVHGEGVAGEMGKDRGVDSLKVGDLFELGPRKWIVVGIMRSSGSTFGSEVWARASLVAPQFGKQGIFTSIVLRAADQQAAEKLAADLKKYKKAQLQAMTETEYFSKLNATNKQFLWAISFVTVVMAVGGVFGVMNTMFAAIAQRTKDIGVLRLMGFARWQILSSFFLESLAIALVGGALGCLLGSFADGWTASSIVSGGQGGGKFVVLQLMVTSDTLAIGMLVSIAMGSLGGFFPALSAVRLTPLETLR